ncbi:MAG: hypothetical protein HQK62_15040, partial [Desulfamplus sp.]|nr:hypothetical protein [Desulfamplus sp.]
DVLPTDTSCVALTLTGGFFQRVFVCKDPSSLFTTSGKKQDAVSVAEKDLKPREVSNLPIAKRDVLSKQQTPFITKAEAIKAIKDAGKTKTHEPVKVKDGEYDGWVGRFKETRDKAKPAPDVKFSIAEDIKAKVKDFISKALKRIDLPNLKLGKVKPEHAEKIEKLTGVKVKGFSHELVSRDIRHAMNSHGNPEREANRKPIPQIAITEDDLNRIPDIINNPDDITKGTKRADDQKSIIYSKEFDDGFIYYVEVVNREEGSLQTKTLWKKPPVSVNATQEVSVGNTSETAADGESLESATTISPPSEKKITKDSVAVKPSSKISTPANLSELPRKQRKIADNLIKQGTLNPVTEAQALNLLQQSGEALYSKSNDTTTPAFEAWFKDSKVVDKDGKPLVVYHGTEKAFNIFNKDKTQDSLFWFTVDKEALESGDVGAASVKTIIPVYLSIQKMAGWDEYDSMTIDQIIADGFDGIKLDNDYIVFSPEQIKSATKNKGTFDSNNPDIRYSKDGLIQGFVLNGKAYIVPENIESGKMWNVIRHEVGTHIGQMLQNDPEFNNLKDRVKARREEQSPTGEAIRKAYSRAEAADTKPEYMEEEVLGYLVEDSPDVSIARKFIALIKKYLAKIGINYDLTQADMVALADIAVRREANRRDKNRQQGKAKFAFAGAKAKNANSPMLAKAQEMKAQGKSREQIWKDTGWWEIVPNQNQWSFEIDDSKLKISEDSLAEMVSPMFEEDSNIGSSTLGNLINYDELFEAYPYLKDVRVILDKDGKAGTGAFKDDEIWLHGGFSLDNLDSINKGSVLLHEIQHAIQQHEGFARGGNLDTVHKMGDKYNTPVVFMGDVDVTYLPILQVIQDQYGIGALNKFKNGVFKVKIPPELKNNILDRWRGVVKDANRK